MINDNVWIVKWRSCSMEFIHNKGTSINHLKVLCICTRLTMDYLQINYDSRVVIASYRFMWQMIPALDKTTFKTYLNRV